MKRILIADLHWGIPSYDFAIDKALAKTFKDEIFPYAEVNNIKKIDQLGDFGNNKKEINKQTAQLIHEFFTKPANKLKIHVTVLCGNHDAYFRNNNSVNTLRTLFSDQFEIVDTEIMNNGVIAYVPWGLPLPLGARYIFTHADVKGFEYQKGVVSKSGYDVNEFKYYERVFCGHFHRKSIKGNVMQIGSLIALNFGEVDSDHGFVVFDDSNGNFEFIKTKNYVFKKVIYQNGADIEVIDFKDKVVSITVLENVDKTKYNNFLETIYSQHPTDVKIVSIESELKNVIEVENVDGVENILSLSRKYIDSLNLVKPMDTATLNAIFEKVYKEAILDK